MNTPNIEETTTESTATATVEEPKASKKANTAPKKPRVAPVKAKPGKKASAGKKAPKVAKSAKSAKKEPGPREGSKTEKVLDLLQAQGRRHLGRPDESHRLAGAFCPGFLSGTIGKKLGLTLVSAKGEDGEAQLQS